LERLRAGVEVTKNSVPPNENAKDNFEGGGRLVG
jgi:hypothetical protein